MPTYSEIAQVVRALAGGYIKTCWIAHVKADYGLTRGVAANRYDPHRRVTPCPTWKRWFVEQALRELGVLANNAPPGF